MRKKKRKKEKKKKKEKVYKIKAGGPHKCCALFSLFSFLLKTLVLILLDREFIINLIYVLSLIVLILSLNVYY